MSSPLVIGGALKRRSTARKRLILSIFNSQFGGRPVLLDEFRWAVLRAEGDRARSSFPDKSYCNRFAECMATLPLGPYKFDLGRPSDLQPRVLSRTALFRLDNWNQIGQIQVALDIHAVISLRVLKIGQFPKQRIISFVEVQFEHQEVHEPLPLVRLAESSTVMVVAMEVPSQVDLVFTNSWRCAWDEGLEV